MGRKFAPILWVVLASTPALGDIVTFRDPSAREGRGNRNNVRRIEGTVLARDSADTILLEGRDLQHFIIRRADREGWERSATPVRPYSQQQLRAALSDELGGTFRFFTTKNYLIAYSCSPEFAKQAGQLFERAFSVFNNYFSQKGAFRFTRPRQPLVAIVCGSREEYIRLVSGYIGPMARNTGGIYSPVSNRMFMFDAFGGTMEKQLAALARVDQQGAEEVQSTLRDTNVSSLIHEAIHQVAYNVGFHNRNVENPAWLVEGMAMFFETPKSENKSGWGGVGSLNLERLEHFQRIVSQRPKDSLRRLIVTDDVFRQRETALDAYSEAWALTYFLAKSKTPSYMRYIKIINARPPLQPYPAEDRLRDFRSAFGKDPEELELELRRYINRIEGKPKGQTVRR